MKYRRDMSYAEKLRFFATGRVTVGRITRLLRTADGPGLFVDRYMPRIRGRNFVSGPCKDWHSPERARRAGEKLHALMKKRAREMGVLS